MYCTVRRFQALFLPVWPGLFIIEGRGAVAENTKVDKYGLPLHKEKGTAPQGLILYLEPNALCQLS